MRGHEAVTQHPPGSTILLGVRPRALTSPAPTKLASERFPRSQPIESLSFIALRTQREASRAQLRNLTRRAKSFSRGLLSKAFVRLRVRLAQSGARHPVSSRTAIAKAVEVARVHDWAKAIRADLHAKAFELRTFELLSNHHETHAVSREHAMRHVCQSGRLARIAS